MNKPSFCFEKRLWKRGFKIVAGLDEVGRGCFAGPVVASAVAFASIRNYQFAISNEKEEIIKIDDSKKLTARQRQIADKWIRKNAISWGIGQASVSEINRLGMGKASSLAFRRAITSANKKLKYRIDYLLIDAFYIPYVQGFPKGRNTKIKGAKNPKIINNGSKQLAIVNGDEKSISIAGASIIAKVYRDNLMISLSKRPKYKKYNWEKNKGYGTREHQKAIKKYGFTCHHRKQFVSTWQQKIGEK